MARKYSHSPGRAFRIAAHLSAVARFVVGAMAIVALAAPVIVERDTTVPMRLVDDGGGSSSSDPPYDPSPSETSPSPSDGPSGTKNEDEEGDSADDDSESIMPVAAQAGISIGVIALAAVALIPGRRPPSDVR